MGVSVRLYSENNYDIQNFIDKFFNYNNKIDNNLLWEKTYENPVEIVDIIGAFIENKETYNINMWINLDNNIFINVTENNADELIRYIFERFPY